MRSFVLVLVTLTVLAALGVGMAFQGVQGGLPGLVTAVRSTVMLPAQLPAQTPSPSPSPAPSPSPSPPPKAAPAPSMAWSSEVVFVDHAAFQRAMWQRPRQTDTLVLDLEGLDSLDAALTLVGTRAAIREVSGALVCWMAAANRDDAATAAQALAREGCTKIYAAP